MKTIKVLTLTLLFAIIAFASPAQQLKNGDNVASVGIGFGTALGSGLGSASPGFAFQFEHGNWDVDGPGTISLGGYLGYQSYSYSTSYFTYKYDYNSSYTVLGIRSAYHYHGLDMKNLDVYGGLMLSFNFYNSSYKSNNPGVYTPLGLGGSNRFFPSIYLGTRYYFSENWGVYGELGYGVAYLTLGAAYHF